MARNPQRAERKAAVPDHQPAPQFVHQVANSVRVDPDIKAIRRAANHGRTRKSTRAWPDPIPPNATNVFASIYLRCGIGHFRLVTGCADGNGFDQILIKRISIRNRHSGRRARSSRTGRT
jgi:hypothetical protein